MSDEAFRIYESALRKQHTRNEARHIRTRVAEARGTPQPAGRRWPFELLQNALDAGPRKGEPSVKIRLCRDSSKILFEHDGSPFTSQELAALLSGGSSKEFESEVTTGRFGTGFLVTHVLAERTRLRGALEVPNGYEKFDLTLDRSGDEDAILENIYSCNDAIRNATRIDDLKRIPSASFEYPIEEDGTLLLGLDALKDALPYLYVTRQNLGEVQFELGNSGAEIWTAGKLIRQTFEDGYVEHRSIHVVRNGAPLPEFSVFRFMLEEVASASALVLATKTAGGWRVRVPELDAPRIYREYPLRASGFLPINFVLDGKFGPDQERSKLLMTDEDKELLAESFSAAVLGVKYAFKQKWENAHLLARACQSGTVFNQDDVDEKQWWTGRLFSYAESLAKLPIIDCDGQFLPAIAEEGAYADFVIPRLLPNSTQDETTVERIWPLVKAATDLYPPRKELAADWTKLAEGWQELGLDLGLVNVSTLAGYVRDEVEMFDQLKVTGDKKEWLTVFLDVVGECWRKRNGVDASVLTGLLPNQNKRLCSPEALKLDKGVSIRLKDICTAIGLDIRSRLLLDGLDKIAKTGQLAHFTYAVETVIRTCAAESDVVDEALKYLGEKLPEDSDCDEGTVELERADVRLMHHLWEWKGREAAPSIRQLPLITSNRRVVRWSRERMMMAPISKWHESARPFASVYPPQRILAEIYCGDEAKNIRDSVEALIQSGIAIADPISTDTPIELKERRLAAISVEDTEGIVIRGEQFSQIALLQPEVLNRCQEGFPEARALLGLVLCHVAPHDLGWRENRTVSGRRSGEEVSVSVRGALWLADLKFRAWVPVPGDDGKPVKMPANSTTLIDLLDPAWLEDNDAAISLLSECFDFDELELRLIGIAPDSERRKGLRNSLAKLVETGGGDPEFYESLREDVEARRRRSRDVDRCRRLGLAVQEAIRLAMEGHGLNLKLVDRGFDYEVTPQTDDVLDDAASWFEVGSYLLEVKATTKGGARLTPTQALMASKETSRYVLCVVDLRGVAEEELDTEWTPARVEPLAKIVSTIGGRVQETCRLVEAATTSPVAIRNESALRYEVPVSVWVVGVSISAWVKEVLAP